MTEEQKAEKKAARTERAEAFAEEQRAAQEAAQTVAVLTASLAQVRTQMHSEMEDEARVEQLQQQEQELEAKLNEKRKQTVSTTTLTEQKMQHAEALIDQLGGEEITQPVRELNALQGTFGERIRELQQEKQKRKLNEEEDKELVALRQTNRRILQDVAKAKKEAPERKKKRETKARQQKALNATDKPKQHLTGDDEAWWRYTGRRQWEARRAQAEREEALRDAGLPLPSEKEPLPVLTIDLSTAEGSSSAQKAAALNERLRELGHMAIQKMVADEAEENAALAEAKKAKADARPQGKKPKTSA